jgi:hypothetical protein
VKGSEMRNITNYKIQITKYKGGHGFLKDCYRLQAITTFNQKFLREGPGGAGVRRTSPIRCGIVSEDFSHFFTCTCNLHLSPLAESAHPGRRRQK